MTTTIVRYQTGPDRADENEDLIRDVVAELTAHHPDGMHYAVYRLGDETFVHILDTGDDADDTALTALAAFNRFADTIHERVTVAPQAQSAVRIASYQPSRSADA